MSSGNDASTQAQKRAAAQGRAQGLDIGWTVFSYLLAGMAAYGAIGWLIGRAVHVSLLFPIGMLVGLAISLGFIIYRYGRVGRGGLGGTASPQDRGGHRGGRPPGGRKGDDR
jgi:F0F1-type ATP synthase assembly protein I